MSKTLVLCGCGKHHVKTDNPSVVNWRDKYWDSRCAFNVVVEENAELRKRIGKVHRRMEDVNCTMCDKPVGRSYLMRGDYIYHHDCIGCG